MQHSSHSESAVAQSRRLVIKVGSSLVTNEGKGSLYVQRTVIGYPEQAPVRLSQGISVTRSWFNSDGQPFDPAKVKVGDLVVVRLNVSSESAVPDALLVEMVPAGFELENPALGNSIKLEDLSIDLAVGYSERMQAQRASLRSWPQCTERYYLLRRAAEPAPDHLRIGAPMAWRDAGQLPLCLLTAEMHNRFIIDQALGEAGAPVVPAIETNSVLTLVLSVAAGQVCSILPSAMVAAVRSERGLEALPLVEPDVRTPIGFMTQRGPRTSRALEARLRAFSSRIFLRRRSDFGVTSTYSSGAMYSQYTLSAVTWLRTHCTCGPSSRSTPQEVCEIACSSCADKAPAPGISRSMM